MSNACLHALCFASALLGACRSAGEPGARPEAGLAREASAPLARGQPQARKSEASERPVAQFAELGRAAPDFELPDQDGLPIRLSDFAGNPVVLEWFNPSCPYVVTAHADGELADCARKLAQQGVVWIAINSGASAQPGGSLEENLAARREFAMEHPLLLDPTGRIGRLYQARCTPHLFVIDAQGVLVYSGAIDNSQEESRAEPINYVQRALDEMNSGQVSIPRTRPYGSLVNYVD